MKVLLLSLALAGVLFSHSFSTRYDVNIGMFGKVGYADVTLKENGNTYEMKLVATLVGTAATLTGKRVETYISKGHIIDGKYRPDSFVKIKKTTREEVVQNYHFDHEKKSIELIEDTSKWVSSTEFDTIAFKIIKNDVQEHSSKTSQVKNFTHQDVLSSYLNTAKSCNQDNKDYNLLAVGAYNEDRDVTLSFLDGLKREEIASSFSKDIGHIYNLHVEAIHKEDKTVDVLIAFDNDGHMKEAVFGDVFWIGEITANRVYHKVSSK